jgi:hypothetical protein
LSERKIGEEREIGGNSTNTECSQIDRQTDRRTEIKIAEKSLQRVGQRKG